ncbi:hypothetical protein [Streptomyces johnsoniae]|uniref:Uncharacterized protein n=1 Tax=Streptomyces johnsoniae TaxID=3075532 RepID=A0ABU2S0W8_9ACTN|nr:hypothetical protein [Streptomyces sp. DSM 41886]MDT0442336.1 hypothetical protein [Streptomyces sp. DSM 41886]
MNALTIQELRLRQATLAEKAERLRQQWRQSTATSSRALALGKEVMALQQRADDYASLICVAEAAE